MTAPSPGQAAYEAWRKTFRSDAPWSDIGDQERAAWEAAAQAAIAAAPACPCGGMPGTACGDELAKRTEEIERLRKVAADAIHALERAMDAEYPTLRQRAGLEPS